MCPRGQRTLLGVAVECPGDRVAVDANDGVANADALSGDCRDLLSVRSEADSPASRRGWPCHLAAMVIATVVAGDAQCGGRGYKARPPRAPQAGCGPFASTSVQHPRGRYAVSRPSACSRRRTQPTRSRPPEYSLARCNRFRATTPVCKHSPAGPYCRPISHGNTRFKGRGGVAALSSGGASAPRAGRYRTWRQDWPGLGIPGKRSC
jgi:hypothetical protein